MVVPSEARDAAMITDRAQHARYLTYLKKFEYFGRGKARLSADEFLALEVEIAQLDLRNPVAAQRRKAILSVLLRD
jgi:hypothetical protein